MDDLYTKIFLDSGNPADTKEVIERMGFLDGQTTNPSLVARNPKLAAKFENGEKLTEKELLGEYHEIITEISEMIPEGSVSIEVYSDLTTTAQQMLDQAREMNTWIDNAHIKFPTTLEGLKAAEKAIKEGMRVNMTLVFSQQQAAAVYSATMGAGRGDVFVSPFVGRLDDIGVDGMDLITNIQKMYSSSDKHVELLAASIRDVEHLLYCLYTKQDIITVPTKVLLEWLDQDMPIPGIDLDQDSMMSENEYLKQKQGSDLPYQDIALDKPWNEYDLEHELTTKGLVKFAEDWNNLLAKKLPINLQGKSSS